ncbi:MAG: hypothetical protein VKO21_06500 [Candidatus Sericytochromatia bacterium]|nr:hypothetical protein [Candidatus Sericytochromatia bacterium]
MKLFASSCLKGRAIPVALFSPVLFACAVPHSPNPRTAAQPFTESAAALELISIQEPDSVANSLTLTVRWPDTRTTQLIPEGVRELACRLVPDAAQASTQYRTIPRLVGSVGTATFTSLRPGGWTLFVEGRNSLGELLVAGSTRVQLTPNGRQKAHVVLAPPNQPLALSRANPLTAFRGETVSLDGTGFGATKGASFSLTLDGRTVGGEALVARPGEPPLGRTSDNTLSFRMPQDATGGVLVLTVDGESVTLPDPFEVVASVSITPSVIKMKVPDSATFSVAFLDYELKPVKRLPNGLTGAMPFYDENPVQTDCGDDEFFSNEAVDALTQRIYVVDVYKSCLRTARGGFTVGVPPLTATMDLEVTR